jgi:VCBS repeat-containing protein
VIAVLATVLALGALPLATLGTGIPTVTALTVAENPMKPGFLPYLTATVTTPGGQPLPSGTLTIVKSPSSLVASQAVGGAVNSFSLHAEGGYTFGDYEFVATYESLTGGNTSSDTLVVQYRDLFPPHTTIHAHDWYLTSNISIVFETEEGATSECRLDDEDWAPCTSPWERTLADGFYRLEVVSTDSVGNVETFPAGDDFRVDTTLPTGTFTMNGGATATNNPIVQINLSGTDNLQPVWNAYFSLQSAVNSSGFLDPGGFWQLLNSGQGTFPLDTTRTDLGGTSSDGVKTVYIQYQSGVIGQLSVPIARSIRLDRSAPTASAPVANLLASSVLSSGRATVRVGWSGSDTGAGIQVYELDQSTDGGGWSRVSSNLTSASTDRKLATGHNYRFRTRAVDKAGNVGAWVNGVTFRLSRYNESHARITRKGTWTRVESSVYLGGAARYAKSKGATASFTFTGKGIGWIARKGPNRGKAEILVNGVKVATVDLYAASYQNQRIVWATSWSTTVSRTITIRVVGTNGRPRVDLDALFTVA